VALGALFFLGAHLAESSFLPLELYFEHRNYLAGFGIYLAVSGALVAGTARWDWLKPPLVMLASAWLLWAGASTGLQAATWSNELVLLLDAEEAHPRSMRVKASLAAKFADMRLVPEMLRYSDAAAALDEPGHARHAARKLALFCVADSPLPETLVAEFEAGFPADALLDSAFSESMQVFVTRLNRGQCPRLQGEPVAAAFRAMVLGPRGDSASPRMYGLLATLEIYLGQYQPALEYLERWLQRDPGAVQAWMMQLHVATLTHQEALRARAFGALDRLDREGRISAEQRDDIALYR
jgi:tetratricopeptide (TPR) repeat protein